MLKVNTGHKIIKYTNEARKRYEKMYSLLMSARDEDRERNYQKRNADMMINVINSWIK